VFQNIKDTLRTCHSLHALSFGSSNASRIDQDKQSNYDAAGQAVAGPPGCSRSHLRLHNSICSGAKKHPQHLRCQACPESYSTGSSERCQVETSAGSVGEAPCICFVCNNLQLFKQGCATCRLSSGMGHVLHLHLDPICGRWAWASVAGTAGWGGVCAQTQGNEPQPTAVGPPPVCQRITGLKHLHLQGYEWDVCDAPFSLVPLQVVTQSGAPPGMNKHNQEQVGTSLKVQLCTANKWGTRHFQLHHYAVINRW
jgi:hypothetical protein